MSAKTILIFLAFAALSGLSAWGFPWNVPLVLIGGTLIGIHRGQRDSA